MEEKEVASVRKITGELIGGYILFSIVFGIVNRILINMIDNKIGNDMWILSLIITVIISGICIFLTYYTSTKVTFKKRSILYADVSAVIKNILIYTVVICTLSTISTCITAMDNIQEVEEKVNSNVRVKMQESLMQYYSTDKEIADYQNQKKEIVEQVKTQITILYVTLGVIQLAIYFGMIPIQKKWIMKYAVSDN